MIYYEWKKLLFRRKGLLLIVLFLIAELASVLLFTQPYDKVLETHRDVYDSYLVQVEGPLTEEKRTFLESEMERLNDIHQELEQLKRDYYSGAVTENDYRDAFDLLSAEDRKYTGFSKLYSQYIFVRESAQRSFLYTGGWEVLLTDQEPDHLFLLVLIVLLVPMFCEEYACRMHEILLTQKRSARFQVPAKVTVALSLTFVLTAILQLFDLGYCAARFQLPHGDYSIQSLFSFGTTVKSLTLWQAFWLQFALKILGYFYVAILILFFSVLLKKYHLTLMASVAILPLPFLTVASCEVFLSIPGPWALTIGSIYLNGGVGELEKAELLRLVLGVLVIESVMLLAIYRSNINKQLIGHTRGLAAILLCVILLSMTGCTEAAQVNYYNRSTANQYETDDYLISGSYEGATLTEKDTGKTYDFPLYPLTGTTISCGATFYGNGNTVYYLKTITHQPSAGWDTIHTYCDLVKLDLDTMVETVVYQWNEEERWFFDLLDRSDGAPDPFFVELLFVHDHDLYYINTADSTLNRMDLTSGASEVMLSEMYAQDIAFDGTNVYYLDQYNRLVLQNLDSGELRTIDEVVAKTFLLTEAGVSFQNLRDQGKTYHWDPITNKILLT